jgi:hypothetical protein
VELAGFKWERCPDGYEIGEKTDFRLMKPESPVTIIKPKSSRLVECEPMASEPSLATRNFAYLDREDEAQWLDTWIDGHGLPFKDFDGNYFCTLDDFWQLRDDLRALIDLFDEAMSYKPGKRRRAVFEELANRFNTFELYSQWNMHWLESQPVLSTNGDEPPVLQHAIDDLGVALYLGFTEMMQLTTGHQKCDWCGTWYIPKRQKRAGAKHNFMSDKCRFDFNNHQAKLKQQKEK